MDLHEISEQSKTLRLRLKVWMHFPQNKSPAKQRRAEINPRQYEAELEPNLYKSCRGLL